MDNGHPLTDVRETLERPASAPPPGRLFWPEFSRVLRAWLRETFSIASILSGLKALIWVLPLSVLIWVYAERELTAQHSETFAVQIRTTDPSRVIRLVDPSDGKVRAELSGPQGQLEQIREKLAQGALSLQIDLPDAQLKPGPHQILASLVEKDSRLVKAGIAVKDCMPREISIYVDQLEDVELEVQPPPELKNVVAAPLFEPHKVKINAPHAVLEDARLSGRLNAVAKLDAIKGYQTPGPHDLTSVPVSVQISDQNLTVSPATVAAHYEVKKSDASLVISSMPVWVIWPPGMSDQYRAEYEPSLANVRITGPDEQIKAMKDPDFRFKPKAIFEVSAADLPPETLRERVLKFDLPPDVKVSQEDAKRTVQFKLVERKGAE